MIDLKNKGAGIIGTVVFHAIIIGLLLLIHFPYVEKQEEEGIMVLIGVENVGSSTPNNTVTSSFDALPSKPVTPVHNEPVEEIKEEMISQNLEQTVHLNDIEQKKKDEELLKKQKEEAIRKAEEERIKKEAEEKAKQEEVIKNRVANVFQNSNNNETGSAGTANGNEGNQGSPIGNSDQGAPKGSAGYGSYDLGGRSIIGGLPKPSFSVNESGNVVVNITVNEDGKVISAILGQGTTTSSSSLRESALAAARKALFEVKKGVSTQSGTITYKFDSDN